MNASLDQLLSLEISGRTAQLVERWVRYPPGSRPVEGILPLGSSASRAEDPGFQFRLRRDFSGVESYQ